MNPSRTCLGRHYRSGAAVHLHFAQGRIAALEPSNAPPEQLPWIAPALLDLQVNGFAGIDFQQTDPAPSDWATATRGLGAAGVGRFFLTLITDHWESMLQRITAWKRLPSGAPPRGAQRAGWHLEGPFLSAEPGYCGAHPSDRMLDPTPDHLLALRDRVGDDPVLLTLAPERPGALAVIREAVRLGFHVFLGHSNADAATLAAAVDAGARGFTHLGNACPQSLDRHDNILWRVLDLAARTPFTVTLIPDSFHVAPSLFRLIHRALPADRILYVSDAMAAAGAPPGRYRLAHQELDVGPDQIVRQPGQTRFAGSALRAIEGVFRAAAMLRKPWNECWDFGSVQPGRCLAGLGPELAVGAPGDVCLFQVRPVAAPAQGPVPLQALEAHSLRLFVAGEEIPDLLQYP